MPNERLVETDLAAQFGTNRANIRIALGRLEQEGLVVLQPGRGARVRLIDEKEAVEIASVRAALEGLVAREAALRITPRDKSILRGLVKELRATKKANDLMAYSACNGRLHAEIRRVADFKTAERLLVTLNSQLVRYQYRTVLLPGRVERSLAEHSEIVEAICAADPDRAETAMRTHLNGVREALMLTMAYKL